MLANELFNFIPPPLFETYVVEPFRVALYPLPLESVQVVPEDGAVNKLKTKPEDTTPTEASVVIFTPPEIVKPPDRFIFYPKYATDQLSLPSKLRLPAAHLSVRVSPTASLAIVEPPV